jgi:hypothetical protein
MTFITLQAAGCTIQSVSPPPVDSGTPGIPITGTVYFPDGTPAKGARVEATSSCTNKVVHLTATAKTGPDGTFAVALFDPDCPMYSVGASLVEQYWYETCDDAFTPSNLRSCPEVDLSSGSLLPLSIRLGLRIGAAHFGVWSREGQHYLSESLQVCPAPLPGADESTLIGDCAQGTEVSFGTGETGLGAEILLPEGNYVLALRTHRCHRVPFRNLSTTLRH